MPIILAGLALLGVGGLVYKEVADSSSDVIDAADNAAPNVAVLGALAIAGLAIWAVARSRK